jgi:hypothetical protein
MKTLIGLAYLTLVFGPVARYVSAQTNVAGCTVKQDKMFCNWPAFKQALASTNAVKLEYSERDPATGLQLKDMAKKLGKNIAKDGEGSDIIFTVVPAIVTGIDVGPADKQILELRAYSTNSRRNLLWVETYIGQKDKPWSMNVHEAVAQFLERLSKG